MTEKLLRNLLYRICVELHLLFEHQDRGPAQALGGCMHPMLNTAQCHGFLVRQWGTSRINKHDKLGLLEEVAG